MILRYIYTGRAFEEIDVDETQTTLFDRHNRDGCNETCQSLGKLFGTENFEKIVVLAHMSMVEGLTDHLLEESCKYLRCHVRWSLMDHRRLITPYKIALKYEKRRSGEHPGYEDETKLNLKEFIEKTFVLGVSYLVKKGNLIK